MSESYATCPICIESFCVDRLFFLECSHPLCFACLREVRKYTRLNPSEGCHMNKCPLCRVVIKKAFLRQKTGSQKIEKKRTYFVRIKRGGFSESLETEYGTIKIRKRNLKRDRGGKWAIKNARNR